MIAGEYCAVVFDLDGTLADTAVDIREALVRALAAEGLPPIDVASVRLMIGGGPRLLVERALHRSARAIATAVCSTASSPRCVNFTAPACGSAFVATSPTTCAAG